MKRSSKKFKQGIRKLLRENFKNLPPIIFYEICIKMEKCSVQQLNNLYDSLLGRTPKLWRI